MFLRTDESGFLWISLLQYLFIELEDALGAKDGRNSTTDEDKVMKFRGLISNIYQAYGGRRKVAAREDARLADGKTEAAD